jgi:hypothetical protein
MNNNPAVAQSAEATDLKSVKYGFESHVPDHPIYNKTNGWTIYGPYRRPDYRKHVIVYDGKNRRTISYPKFLMECKLQRELTKDETVDHKDNDVLGNEYENLQLMSRADNIRKSTKGITTVEITCIRCGRKATKRKADVDANKRKGCAGPYCSKSCAGRVHN